MKLNGKHLIDKSEIAGFINKSDLNKEKVAALATKAELKLEKYKKNKIRSIWFKLCSCQKSFWILWYSKLFSKFTQNWYSYLPMDKYFQTIFNTYRISKRKSKALSVESIEARNKSGNNLASWLNFIGNNVRVKFLGSYLKRKKITYTHE